MTGTKAPKDLTAPIWQQLPSARRKRRKKKEERERSALLVSTSPERSSSKAIGKASLKASFVANADDVHDKLQSHQTEMLELDTEGGGYAERKSRRATEFTSFEAPKSSDPNVSYGGHSETNDCRAKNTLSTSTQQQSETSFCESERQQQHPQRHVEYSYSDLKQTLFHTQHELHECKEENRKLTLECKVLQERWQKREGEFKTWISSLQDSWEEGPSEGFSQKDSSALPACGESDRESKQKRKRIQEGVQLAAKEVVSSGEKPSLDTCAAHSDTSSSKSTTVTPSPFVGVEANRSREINSLAPLSVKSRDNVSDNRMQISRLPRKPQGTADKENQQQNSLISELSRAQTRSKSKGPKDRVSSTCVLAAPLDDMSKSIKPQANSAKSLTARSQIISSKENATPGNIHSSKSIDKSMEATKLSGRVKAIPTQMEDNRREGKMSMSPLGKRMLFPQHNRRADSDIDEKVPIAHTSSVLTKLDLTAKFDPTTRKQRKPPKLENSTAKANDSTSSIDGRSKSSFNKTQPVTRGTKQRKSFSPDHSTDDGAEPNYKYQEVVRCREARRRLPGHTCEECQAFVDVVCNAPGGHVFDRNQFMDCSRHRSRHTPPQTPEGFWELSFVDEIEARTEESNGEARI